MPGQQAKLITPSMLQRMLSHVRHSHDALRNQVIVLLSVRAGLRAAEIAQLTLNTTTNGATSSRRFG